MMMRSQAEALTAFVRTIRPEWDTPGVMVAINRAKDLGSPADIGRALIQLADDDQIKTPGMLCRPGRHWSGTKTARRRPDSTCPDHPGQPAGRCRECDRSGTPRPADFMAEFRALRRASTRTKTGTVVPPTQGDTK